MSDISTSVLIRPVETDDLSATLAINNAAVPDVNELTVGQLDRFREIAHTFSVVEHEGQPAGLMIVLSGPTAAYDSTNYAWFCQRYDTFLYVDRIAVAESLKGHGVGRRLYESLFANKGDDVPVCAEVNILPSNEPSLQFHQRMGFGPVGARRFGDDKWVVMLATPPALD